MEIIKNRVEKELISYLGNSRYKYTLPVKLANPEVWQKSPAHTRKFRNAVDIIVPLPSLETTLVYAPAPGKIEYLELSNDKWGETREYSNFLNFINVRVGRDEFYELSHIGSIPNQPPLRIGQTIEMGQPIAIAALNGWITTTDGVPDAHVHMMVGRWFPRGDFRSVKIRWY